jgi:hypothetical protein
VKITIGSFSAIPKAERLLVAFLARRTIEKAKSRLGIIAGLNELNG